MSEKLNDIEAGGRVQFAEGLAGDGRPHLQRRQSSISVFSSDSLDPSLAMPVTYRTMSAHIEEGDNIKLPEAVEFDVDYHLVDTVKLCERFGVTLDKGFGPHEVESKRAEYGKNVPSPAPRHLVRDILEYMFGGFGSILLIGSILVFISWKPLGQPPAPANLGLAIVLAVVFVIQSLFNAWQDWSSSRTMKSITAMLPEDCIVLRDGVKTVLPAADIVPGDILYFKAGNKLPADIRFLNVSTDAKFDRSILTGESLPIAAVVDSNEPNYLETKCIGMQGTYCSSGSGTGLVVSTGDNTVFGNIAKLTNTPVEGATPLQKEIRRFVFIIVGLMAFMDIIIIGVWAGYIRKYHSSYIPVDTFIVDLVSVAIAFVPEGLPIALTASLTITANIMKKNSILCKSLKTVETLGTVSVLLSDKTGTLTKNQMVVTDAITDVTPIHTDDTALQRDDPAFQQLQVIAAVCNIGEFDPTTAHMPIMERKIIADATDAAVLRFAAMIGSVEETRALWNPIFDLAFNSKNKFAIRVSEAVSDKSVKRAISPNEKFDRTSDHFLAIKGAPDILMPRCSFYVGKDGNIHDLKSIQTTIDRIKDQWSAQGKRVLLLARKVIHPGDVTATVTEGEYEQQLINFSASNLVLCGLVGIVDPLRAEVPEVVRTLRGAGVRTMMVTGDFKLTAQAIATDAGIITTPKIDGYDDLPIKNSNAIVISGPELVHLNDDDWDTVCSYEEAVFARTTPSQKLRIVKEYKSRENVVAMTGDGVNDAPSLKEADIGIAPSTGSDIAIEAADMVLLDSFAAIIEALKYGRVVFSNLRKIICYLLPAGCFSEFWPVMTSIIFGLPQILSSFLMIVICCLTDCGTAIALSYEKPESDVLCKPPRNIKKDRLVDWRLMLHSYLVLGSIMTICSFSMSYWWLERQNFYFSTLWWSFGDYSLAPVDVQANSTNLLNKASGIYFVTLVVMQWFNAMATRNRYLSIFTHPPLFNKATQNLHLVPAIIFALIIVFIFCYIPGLQSVAGTSTIPVIHWFLPMAFGIGLLSLDELRKAGVRRWPKGLLAKCAW